MNENDPKVSIVLPTYNGSKYIRQSIDSCLYQTYKNIELIIVDDGSTDSTSIIVQAYNDDRIHYYRHKENKGLPHSLNSGFSLSTGQYLTWTSDDNYYAKEAIERMLYFIMEENHKFVYTDYYIFSENNSDDLECVTLPDIVELKNVNCIGACFLYAREVKEVVGVYDTETILAEDYDYWIRVSKKFNMFHINDRLYYYRKHSKSLTETKYHEIMIVGTLIKLQHNLISIDEAVSIFVGLKLEKVYQIFSKITKLNKLLGRKFHIRRTNLTLNSQQIRNTAKLYRSKKFIKKASKLLLSRKILKPLKEFEDHKLSLKEAVTILKKIINIQS